MATLSRAEEGSRREAEAQDGQGNTKTRNTKSKGGKVDSPRQDPCRGGLRGPGKSLAEATCPTPARPPPVSLRVMTPSTNVKTEAQERLRGGMQIFVETEGL